ncbi:MAG: ATP-binding cassette domain-containing protein [Elusimicrobia bacterium]|nr:ATP-binding cassette domain-containing protein [Elusimicrobiota bacterium]
MIRLESVAFRYPGAPSPLLRGFSLEVPTGQFCVIVGASGSGKSTVLRLVNALLRPQEGRVRVHGEDTAGADPIALRRGIGYVPQRGGLLPHMTARENAALVPRLMGWKPEDARAAAEEALATVQLPAPAYGDRYPDELSGGQRQRVAVARALAARPGVVLMDESFGALDNALREELQDELGPLMRRLGKTVLFVTHDMHEAVHMADRLVVMDAGRILADGTPAEVVLGAKDPVVERLLGRRRKDLERFVREKEDVHG